jgi:hypothetical protein
VQSIRKAGATPVIMQDNPAHEPDLSHCVLYRKRGWIAADTNCSIPREKVEREQQATVAAIRRVAEKIAGTIIIDPISVLCDARECPTSSGNLALYKDSNHLNERAAALMGERYLSQVGNPLRAQRRPQD